jgi:hypothetical protein
MAELKTRPNDSSVEAFLDGITDERQRSDSRALCQLMREATALEPRMWGDSIVGFGSYHYCYGSGREGEWFLTGFSPRKQNLTVYIMAGFDDYPELMARLGKVKTGKSCLYLKRLSDVDAKVLEKLIAASVKDMKKRYP